MLRAYCWMFVCGTLLLTVPTMGHAQKKKDGAPPPPATPGTPDDYAQLNKQKEVQGTLITRDPDLGPDVKIKRGLSFRYDYEVTDVNPKYKAPKLAKPQDFTKEIQQLAQKQVAAMQIPNIQKRMAMLQQLALQQQQLQVKIQQEQFAQAQREAAARENDIKTGNLPYIKVSRAKEFDLDFEKDVIVRRLKPAEEYNDKGFLKEYTKEELEKLHLVDNKDGKKPGYPSKYDELLPKQTIVVYLKPGKKETSSSSKPDKKTDKTDPAADPVIPVKPSVRMIVIVEDVSNPNGIGVGDLPPLKKKKNKQ